MDLRDLIQKIAEDYAPLFASAGVSLEVAIPSEAVWVRGDAARLAQAVGNLLHNASKFSGRGARVALALARDDRAGEVLIRVRDWGVGISREMLPRLFEPFTQADSTLDRSRGGLGLGLSLIKGMIALHQGRVEAPSDGPGKGAHFAVWLPLAAEPAGAAPAPAVRGPSRRVLIIEDNDDAAESLREVLALAAHEVQVAHDGPEGIAKARSFKPDVVRCDIGLPGMSGEVARGFRSDRELISVHLVALTGYASPEDVAAAERAGFERHLAKPPSPEQLQQVLASMDAVRPAGGAAVH